MSERRDRPSAVCRPSGIRPGDVRSNGMPADVSSVEFESRQYDGRVLEAIALVAYGFLDAGAARLALVLFEGLCAVRPDWSYPHLARGVCAEQLGERAEARRAYDRAETLDPADPQAALNSAELALREGNTATAVLRLRVVLHGRAASERQVRRARALMSLARTAPRARPRATRGSSDPSSAGRSR